MKPSERIKELGIFTYTDILGNKHQGYDEAQGIVKFLDEEWTKSNCFVCKKNKKDCKCVSCAG